MKLLNNAFIFERKLKAKIIKERTFTNTNRQLGKGKRKKKKKEVKFYALNY